MSQHSAVLILGLLLTAVLVAALWYGAPVVGLNRPPAGLVGMVFAIGVVGSLALGRRARRT